MNNLLNLVQNLPQAQGNKMDNLARLILNTGSQPQTVNIGGSNIPVRRKGDFLNQLLPVAQNMSASYLRNNFLKGVQEITQSSISPDEKVNQLVGLVAKNGTDYGLGVKDIISAYQNQPRTFTPPEGFRVKGYNAKGEPSYERDVGGIDELDSQKQIQARTLARKLVGARRQNDILPSIVKRMNEGASIDQIEDELRYSGQSAEFSGPVRNAAQSILINTSQDKAQMAMDYIDDKLSSGDIDGAKNQLKRLARANAGTDESKMIAGKERTIKLLDEIQEDIQRLELSGVNTNIFTGTAEQVAKKIGTVRNPELRKMATKIQSAIQSYRRAMSGVAFSVPESVEYADMFPSIGRTGAFNTATVQGLKEVFAGDLDNFYGLSMGEDAYKELFGGGMRNDVSAPIQNQTSPSGTKDFSYLW